MPNSGKNIPWPSSRGNHRSFSSKSMMEQYKWSYTSLHMQGIMLHTLYRIAGLIDSEYLQDESSGGQVVLLLKSQLGQNS